MEKHEVIKLLQGKGINPTRQRMEIAELLFERSQHLCADQIITLLKSKSTKASKATVYNTLNLFSKQGLLRELFVEAGKTFYDTNTSKHHHVYNIDNGEIWDVSHDSADEIENLPELPAELEYVGMDVIYRVSGKWCDIV